jgi:hypothetical protein
MNKVLVSIIAALLISSIVWIPLTIYFLRLSNPPLHTKWIVSRGIVLVNGTAVFNATIVVFTDETYMEKGWTNKTGQFEVYSPYPLNSTLVECFVYAIGFAETVQDKLLPITNMTFVKSDNFNDYYGYVDFEFSLSPLGGQN